MNSNDLRYIKTEKNLKKTLLHMLESQRLEDISIKSICLKAECSRNAFYKHYPTKEDLYNAIINDIITVIEESSQPIDCVQKYIAEHRIKTFTYKLLKVIDEHRAEFLSLKNGNDTFLIFLSDSLYRAFIQHYSFVTDNKPLSKKGELITKYFCCGIAGFIEEWLNESSISLEVAQKNLDECTRDNFKKMRDLLI